MPYDNDGNWVMPEADDPDGGWANYYREMDRKERLPAEEENYQREMKKMWNGSVKEVRMADPELERLLAEEEQMEREVRMMHRTGGIDPLNNVGRYCDLADNNEELSRVWKVDRYTYFSLNEGDHFYEVLHAFTGERRIVNLHKMTNIY